jgi:hypothetical protein
MGSNPTGYQDYAAHNIRIPFGDYLFSHWNLLGGLGDP